jgi:hypothetical protein
VLASRSYRIELMFTGLAILLGKVAAPVIAVRAVIRGDELELLPVPLLLSAIVQYIVFKQRRRHPHLLAARKRPGREQLTGAWTGGIRRTDAPTPIDIGSF